MAIRTYKVTLDTKNTIATDPVYFRQGDKTGAVTIDASVTDNGVPVSLDGLTPTFRSNTADGKAVIVDGNNFTITDATNGRFTYRVPNALGSVPGKVKSAYFTFSDTDGVESTFGLVFIIQPSVDMTQEQAKDYITIVDGIFKDYQSKVSSTYNNYKSQTDSVLKSFQDQVNSTFDDFQKQVKDSTDNMNNTFKQLSDKTDGLNTSVQQALTNFSNGDFYNKSETDSKDNATLASAKSYADSGDSTTLTQSKAYADNIISDTGWTKSGVTLLNGFSVGTKADSWGMQYRTIEFGSGIKLFQLAGALNVPTMTSGQTIAALKLPVGILPPNGTTAAMPMFGLNTFSFGDQYLTFKLKSDGVTINVRNQSASSFDSGYIYPSFEIFIS